MSATEITRHATFGPCARCGRIAVMLESHPKSLFVIHADGFPRCPVQPGDMPAGRAALPTRPARPDPR